MKTDERIARLEGRSADQEQSIEGIEALIRKIMEIESNTMGYPRVVTEAMNALKTPAPVVEVDAKLTQSSEALSPTTASKGVQPSELDYALQNLADTRDSLRHSIEANELLKAERDKAQEEIERLMQKNLELSNKMAAAANTVRNATKKMKQLQERLES